MDRPTYGRGVPEMDSQGWILKGDSQGGFSRWILKGDSQGAFSRMDSQRMDSQLPAADRPAAGQPAGGLAQGPLRIPLENPSSTIWRFGAPLYALYVWHPLYYKLTL